ncbi:phage holin [Staphylococcus equorum]|uniref:phage holin n=1 Tax=Staphylococcus equorum TaxID=246432 RepID=UPI0024081E65|nr:phage holin [Staphylococcus equorum]MDG0843175.1 phage holin [Staphylococcus equorum]
MTKGTIVRLSALVLSIINQKLVENGISPLPFTDEQVSELVMWGFMAYTAYKDNPVTKEGKVANNKLKELKAQKKAPKSGMAPMEVENKEGDI